MAYSKVGVQNYFYRGVLIITIKMENMSEKEKTEDCPRTWHMGLPSVLGIYIVMAGYLRTGC